MYFITVYNIYCYEVDLYLYTVMKYIRKSNIYIYIMHIIFKNAYYAFFM